MTQNHKKQIFKIKKTAPVLNLYKNKINILFLIFINFNNLKK